MLLSISAVSLEEMKWLLRLLLQQDTGTENQPSSNLKIKKYDTVR